MQDNRTVRVRRQEKRAFVGLAAAATMMMAMQAGAANASPSNVYPAAVSPATAAKAAALDPTFPANGFRVFSHSFREDKAKHLVKLPLYSGTSHGKKVSFVVLDASTRSAAAMLGVNFSARLGNARGTAASQRVRLNAHGVVFPKTVDFRPVRKVVAGPTGFPPKVALPGAIGERGYSPLISLPDGTVLNAPQILNSTGRADKVVKVDRADRTVTYRETNGFYDHKAVHYASFEATNAVTAALENATLAPALNASPFERFANDNRSAREEIGILTNGQLGRNNPQRQGLSSAILDGLDPLNVLADVPEGLQKTGYSPLWDANVGKWTRAAIAAGRNRRQTSFPDVEELGRKGIITKPDGSRFGRAGFVINCPVISIRR